MGLLDALNSPDSAFAMGLLDASGPSRMPVSFGQALQAGYGSAMQARDQNQAAAMRQMQMEAAKREQEAAQQRQLMLSQYRSQLSPQEQMQFDLDPQGFIKQKFAKPEEYTLTPGAARFRGNEQIASVPTAPKESTPPALVAEIQAWEAMPPGPQKDMMGRILQARAKGDSGGTPYFTPIPTEMGLGSFNNRTGGFSLVNGGGIVKPSDSPMLQGQIAGAKSGAQAAVGMQTDATKAIKKSDQFVSVAKQAESLLNQSPTASGVGAAVDAAGRLVGASSKSNEVASQLEAVSGWMVSNVPRMEGPQSNFDVENYKTMAGKVGDRTLPVAERKAALNAVIALQEKYKSMNQTADENKQRTVVRTGMYGGRKVVQYSDGTTDYAD